jgi:hypothetical protein
MKAKRKETEGLHKQSDSVQNSLPVLNFSFRTNACLNTQYLHEINNLYSSTTIYHSLYGSYLKILDRGKFLNFLLFSGIELQTMSLQGKASS